MRLCPCAILIYSLSNDWDKGNMTLEEANQICQGHFPGGYKLVPTYDQQCRSMVLDMEFNTASDETLFMIKYPGGEG